MNSELINKSTSIAELRKRLHEIENIVIKSQNPELRLRNEAVKIGSRLANLGC
jgi:hypothetical protein